MAEQRSNEECKRYFSWMRGHHAYKDIFEPEIDKQLTLQREPENAKDKFAVAITEENGRIVGHIPLGLSKIVSCFLKRDTHSGLAIICGKRINRGGGLGLEIPVVLELYGKRQYLEKLDELINSSETAMKSLRKEDEGLVSTKKPERKRPKLK